MKKIYESPLLQTIHVEENDVIRTSQVGVQDSFKLDINWDLGIH